MKTSQVKSFRFIAAVAIMLFIGSSLMANVKIYQYSAYRGKVIEVGPGEHAISKFSKFFPRTSYVSIKLPKGYAIDIDYNGRGWRKGNYKTYNRSVSKLRNGFKKIRIRKNNATKPIEGEKPTNEKPTCSNDWSIQFFQNPNFKGNYDCYPMGFHKYQTSFRSLPGSFKIKSGYEVVLYKYRKVVKKLSGSVSDARYNFDQFKVQKKKEEATAECGDDWVVKLYKSNGYKGDYVCYPKGKHKYAPSFRSYPQSVQVKKGYEVIFMSRGRKVKGISGSVNSLKVPRFDYIVMAAINEKPSSGRSTTSHNPGKSASTTTSKRHSNKIDICINEWKVRFFEAPSYKGEKYCYVAGRYNYRDNGGSLPRSIMVKSGYELTLYRGSRVVKVVSGGHTNVNLNFDKFSIRTITAQSANGINCGSSWVIQLCNNQNFSGPSSCYTQGTHSYRPSSLGYPKSVQVRRGYYVVFKYRGKIVNTTPRSVKNFRFQFDEMIVKPDPKYLIGFPVSW